MRRVRTTPAEPLLPRVLQIRLVIFRDAHRDVAVSYENLAALRRAQHNNGEAAAYYQQAIKTWEKVFGPDAPDIAADLNNLGAIAEFSDQKSRAEPLLLRAVALDEKYYGRESPELAAD